MKTHVFPAPSLLVFVFALVMHGPLFAGDAVSVGDLRVERPWSRVTPPGTPVGAGYMTIVNTATESDRLIAAESPAAGRVQIHRSVKKDGQSSMVHQKDGVVVPPDGRIEFSPGGYHLMLMQLGGPLEEGDRIPVTLHFERAGAVEVELVVRALTAGAPADD
jgi:copper(I)-binding protein